MILRVGAAAVTQASAELTAHATALRLQAQAAVRAQSPVDVEGGASQPSVNTGDLAGDD